MSEQKPHRPWCKIVEHPKFGQILAYVDYDEGKREMQFIRRWHSQMGFIIATSAFPDSDAGFEAAYACLADFTLETALQP